VVTLVIRFGIGFMSEQTAKDIRVMMNMKGDAVRQIRSRMLKRIREEYAKFDIEAPITLSPNDQENSQ